MEPDEFSMEGAPKETEVISAKKRHNKQKVAKRLRNLGQGYISTTTKKIVSAKTIKDRCNSQNCQKQGKRCGQIKDETRQNIFQDFMNLGDLTRQREFLARHVTVFKKKRQTTTEEKSRRENSRSYHLTVNLEKITVCKKFFLNTLGIPERVLRTALSKLSDMGVMEGEKRGGRKRNEEIRQRENNNLKDIENHIDRYPRVESHFCRSSTSKMYLHPELSLRKMYKMFVVEQRKKTENENISSFTTFRKVFKSKNLSFLRPKKDQCSLCINFREGNDEIKNSLKEKYEKHILEKNLVRQKKDEDKLKAEENPSEVVCAVFDLQQVIYLPISNESAIFYKSRLSVFNFTVYDAVTKKCFCFTWDETNSKRGSAEIATSLFRAISDYAENGREKIINLYSDGCYGQNKNSIVASMLLYVLQKHENIKEISLKFFETNHGQNEGDSAHSAISYALKHSGDLYIPSQLYPVMRCARIKKPYDVIPMSFRDFWDFKSFSKELRILSVRESETKNRPIKWTDMMEVMVKKEEPMAIFFKYSHNENNYDKIVLKQRVALSSVQLKHLNEGRIPLSKKKYDDLTALCKGQTPVVRMPELQQFFFSLPHEN